MATVLQIPDTTDEQLAAEAAREGSDGPAFTTLVGRHQERVWRICFRLMGNEPDASDAAQEVFVAWFLNRGEFAGRSKFATWLHAVAVRTCLKLRRGRGRRQRREAELVETWRTQTKETHTDKPGLTLDLSQMLETLDDEDRALVILKYAEEYSYEELAEMFGLSESACKMRVSRAREELQRRFPDEQV